MKLTNGSSADLVDCVTADKGICLGQEENFDLSWISKEKQNIALNYQFLEDKLISDVISCKIKTNKGWIIAIGSVNGESGES